MKELVIGIGEALFDMLPEGKKLGGAPANFAYHVSQFGINSCAVSAIGKDEQGRELTNELDSHNLKYQMDEVDYPTGEVQVSLDINGIPCYDIKENVAWGCEKIDDERVINSLEKAQIYDTIKEYPQGINSNIIIIMC